jgi:hypothetical protein
LYFSYYSVSFARDHVGSFIVAVHLYITQRFHCVNVVTISLCDVEAVSRMRLPLIKRVKCRMNSVTYLKGMVGPVVEYAIAEFVVTAGH